MGDIRKRTLADDVRAARATPTRDTFEQGGFAGVAGKVAANVALIPSDYIEFIKTAPVVAGVGAAALAAPNTELGRQVYSKAAVALQKASETSIPERIKYLAENPPDVTNAVVQLAGPNMAWKAARVAAYEAFPIQTALYARSLAQRKSLQTTLPKRTNTGFWHGLKTLEARALASKDPTLVQTLQDIKLTQPYGVEAFLNPEVITAVKSTLKRKLGREFGDNEIHMIKFGVQEIQGTKDPALGAAIRSFIRKRQAKGEGGLREEWLVRDDMFTALNKFYYVKDGDDYHVVDLYKFFPLYEDHAASIPPTKELVKKLLRGRLEEGSTMGIMSAPQDLGIKHGAAFPVYWKVTKPE